MSTLLKRTADGTTQVGNSKCKVPTNMSVLGIIATNGVIDGSEYRDDYYIYVDNIPIKKWFSMVDGVRVWTPKLYDLPSLYRLYKKTRARFRKQWAFKVLYVFKNAMIKSLPENPPKGMFISLKFDEDIFWFRTVLLSSGYRTWEMISEEWIVENREIC